MGSECVVRCNEAFSDSTPVGLQVPAGAFYGGDAVKKAKRKKPAPVRGWGIVRSNGSLVPELWRVKSDAEECSVNGESIIRAELRQI